MIGALWHWLVWAVIGAVAGWLAGVVMKGSGYGCIGPQVQELVNLQDVRGKAKPYQIRQFLRLVERYNLTIGDES